MSGTQEPLVEVDRLVDELDRADPPTLLDVRWRLTGPPGRDDYLVGHLPGAVFIDLDTALCGPPGAGGRHPLPDPAALQATLRAAGVRAGHSVVVYDGGDGLAAARAWWTLRWAGHRPVRLLHGGWPAWVAAGRPVSTTAPDPVPGDVEVRPGDLPVLDAAQAARLAAADDAVLLDVRAAPRYAGEVEPIDPVAGHVPGAANLPAGEYVGPDGRFPAADVLRERFAAAGVTEGRSVGAYCGSGVTAAQAVLALHLAGRPDAALYVGSWSNWVADPARPVASGPTPGR
ncbi:sulfurtransferase [Micromonospora sp. ALFpr18c]|uniref:sulfurtransferase n=1 Tax=unclassified Micromonospora TaxID=2617518 RepID=UPI00124B4BBB|nr:MULTISPECIES: sulfurtransferase [unclassified Micromonospora]KAB1931683.1 sulfurtransferase [Micromonospora sp. ALFpr18c]MDG4759391.1 sulfurtransferase [Micromonospora sp. WMMD710]